MKDIKRIIATAKKIQAADKPDYAAKAIRDYLMKMLGTRISRKKHLGDTLVHEATNTPLHVSYYNDMEGKSQYFSIKLKFGNTKFRKKIYAELLGLIRKAIASKTNYKVTQNSKNNWKDYDRGVVAVVLEKEAISIGIHKTK